jgi:hypothetical protein
MLGGVGVSRFQDPRIQPLQYASMDAENVYRYLAEPSGGNFRPETVVLLQDEQATRAAVVSALERIKARAGPDDLVFVYLSSHGTPPDKYGGVHVITQDAAVIPRDQVWQTSVSEDILRSFIQGCGPNGSSWRSMPATPTAPMPECQAFCRREGSPSRPVTRRGMGGLSSIWPGACWG